MRLLFAFNLLLVAVIFLLAIVLADPLQTGSKLSQQQQIHHHQPIAGQHGKLGSDDMSTL
jgi:hypothetical protein